MDFILLVAALIVAMACACVGLWFVAFVMVVGAVAAACAS